MQSKSTTNHPNMIHVKKRDAEAEKVESENIPKKQEEHLSSDIQLLRSLARKSYKDQAIWFLNSYREGHDTNISENVWTMHKKCAELDPKGEEGCCLNVDLDAHVVLEIVGSPVTQVQLRNFLDAIDPKRKNISLVELCFCFFDSNRMEGSHDSSDEDEDPFWKQMIRRTRCYNGAETTLAKESLEQAKRKLRSAMDAKEKLLADAKEARSTEEQATRQEEESKHAATLSRTKEQAFSEAKSKEENALEDLRAQEEVASKKRQEMESIAGDMHNGIVKRQKAKMELASLDNEDPLPLRTAKIKNEAAVKKLQKCTDAAANAALEAEAARAKAQDARKKAKDANEKALEAAKQVDATITQATKAFEQTKTLLEEMMTHQDAPYGALFYIDREMKEAGKFVPTPQLKKMRNAAEEAKKRIGTPPRGRGEMDELPLRFHKKCTIMDTE